MSLKITAIEYFLPAMVANNEYLVDQLGFNQEFIERKLGIKERRRASPEESCHSLAHEAVKKLLETHRIAPDAIDFLIMVTQNPDYKLPNVASLLQASLKLRNNLAALDINLGCSGFVYALAVAKGLEATCPFSLGLIVTCDPYSKVISTDDRITAPLFGDAAAAVLLESCPGEGIGAFDFGTDGTNAEALIVRTGGSRYPQPGSSPRDNYLFMDGRAIYNFMMKRVPLSIKECLKLNQLSMDDIDFFVFHQASKYMLDSLRTRINIPAEKTVYELEFCGNTISSSIPIALKKLSSSYLGTGKRILLSGFGVGLSWASVVIRI
jgi:3-oxoacyl-[acyl-carrier-protein] synthase-3